MEVLRALANVLRVGAVHEQSAPIHLDRRGMMRRLTRVQKEKNTNRLSNGRLEKKWLEPKWLEPKWLDVQETDFRFTLLQKLK